MPGGTDGTADLDTFVAAHRGRRDAFVWGLGIGAGALWLYTLVASASYLVFDRPGEAHQILLAVAGAVGVAAHLAYLLRRRWSRAGILLPYAVVLLGEGALMAVRRETLQGMDLVVFGIFLAGLVPSALAWRSPLNRLAFGLEVPPPRLEVARRRHEANTLARVALILAIPTVAWPLYFELPFPFGILAWSFVLIPLPLAITAWTRAETEGVGRRGTAIAATVLCVIATVVPILVAVAMVIHGHLPGQPAVG